MAKYFMHFDVEEARGYQTFSVEADSEKDALAKHVAGLSEFEGEEIEVYRLSRVPADIDIEIDPR